MILGKRVSIVYTDNQIFDLDFLISVSTFIKGRNCLLCTQQGDGSDSIYYKKLFDYHLVAKDDRICEMISQMIDKYDFLFINEFSNLSKKCQEVISNIDKPIMLLTTTLNIPDNLLRDGKIFYLKLDKINGQNHSTIEYDNHKMFRWDFFKLLERDLKINSILNE